VGKLEAYALLVEISNGTAAMWSSVAVSQKLYIELSYDPAILSLSI
jgi:hypothetical protein